MNLMFVGCCFIYFLVYSQLWILNCFNSLFFQFMLVCGCGSLGACVGADVGVGLCEIM